MADEPRDIRTMPKREYERTKREAIRRIGIDAAEAREATVLEQIKNAPDDTTRRKILRQFSR